MKKIEMITGYLKLAVAPTLAFLLVSLQTSNHLFLSRFRPDLFIVGCDLQFLFFGTPLICIAAGLNIGIIYSVIDSLVQRRKYTPFAYYNALIASVCSVVVWINFFTLGGRSFGCNAILIFIGALWSVWVASKEGEEYRYC